MMGILGEFIFDMMFTFGICMISFAAGMAYSEKHRNNEDQP